MKICNRHKALALIKDYLPKNPVIIEAGAYKGHDSLYMSRVWPNAVFHLFEPVPDIFDQLKLHTTLMQDKHYWPYALSDHNGYTAFYIAEKEERPGKSTQAGSLLKPALRKEYSPIIYPYTITVPTITLDTWTEKYAINHIDFIWLDVQGHELSVLQHAQKTLKNVSAIFVELHFIKAYEKQPLADEIISWLNTQGFTMIARDYAESPTWFFGNGFFIRNLQHNEQDADTIKDNDVL